MQAHRMSGPADFQNMRKGEIEFCSGLWGVCFYTLDTVAAKGADPDLLPECRPRQRSEKMSEMLGGSERCGLIFAETTDAAPPRRTLLPGLSSID